MRENEPPVATEEPPSRRYTVTPQEYLVRERAAKYRSEYFDGEIVAMAGAPEQHVTITGNIFGTLFGRLRPPCRVWHSELKVQVQGGETSFVYPDVLVVCGEAHFIDPVRDTLTNPTVVFEVLSPSTERKDRTEKAQAYRRIESLQAYVFVSQKEPLVEVYSRGRDGSWAGAIFPSIEGRVPLDAIGCELKLAEIYKHTPFVPGEGAAESTGSA